MAGVQYEQPDAFCFELDPAIMIDLNPKARFKRLCSPLSSLLSLSTMSPRISTHNHLQLSKFTMTYLKLLDISFTLDSLIQASAASRDN